MKFKLIILALVGTGCLLFIWRQCRIARDHQQTTASASHSHSGAVPASTPIDPSASQAASGNADFLAAHLTPITFYGKVIDQDGAPVAGATVIYRGHNVPWGGGMRRESKSDANGLFTLTTRGLSLYVDVSKQGYRALPSRSDLRPEESVNLPKSSGTFQYAKVFGEAAHKPNENAPVIFTLHKSGVLESLISLPGRDLLIPKDGSAVRIELNPGDSKTTIEIQCWTDDQHRDAERQYDWHFKVTVPRGGLVERPDELAFIAPPGGYSSTFEYSMPKERTGREWKDEVSRRFFVRFVDETYAVLDIKMIAGGGHFAVIRSHLNPRAGSRNLETPPPEKPKYR